MHSKNTTQESSEKIITDRHQQPYEETDDTVEDTTYKMPPLGYVDESDSNDEVLVKRIKKIKEGTKPRPKKMQLRVKKCVKSQPEKKENVKKSLKPPVQSPKSVQSVPKLVEGDIKYKKIFQSRMSSSGFVRMIAHFNDAQTKSIQDMGFGGFLHLQVTEL
ncbi:hypothetical protein Cgig2_030025 [Carnegiea gigantea]|uniref:Uncharacterized protein n=1 Tax=Carnegiea gigantea TaxID=171969 RepID=A0A9Q1JLZ2_9CARY|nr:hypothetical protein Cgig2_030025 [Carnegiea gigantea]